MKVSSRAHRLSIWCAVVVVLSLGWSPLQALAADEPVAIGSALTGTTEPAVDTVSDATSSTIDAVSDATSSSVETISTTTSGPIDAVSDAASSTVDAVSDAASSTVDAVSDAASGTVGAVSGTVGGATAALGGAAGGVGGSLDGAIQAYQTSSGSASPSLFSSEQQAAAIEPSSRALPQKLRDDLVLLAERGRMESAIIEEGSCASVVSAACESTVTGDVPGSLEGSVASILDKLLALTGVGLLSWITASCVLALMGALILSEAKRRSRGTRSVQPGCPEAAAANASKLSM